MCARMHPVHRAAEAAEVFSTESRWKLSVTQITDSDIRNKVRAIIPDARRILAHKVRIPQQFADERSIHRWLVLGFDCANDLIMHSVRHENVRTPTNVHRPNRTPTGKLIVP